MTERTIVSRHDWLHGLALCPSCGLPLAVDRDLVKEIRHLPDPKVAAVDVTHRRCGASFRLEFRD